MRNTRAHTYVSSIRVLLHQEEIQFCGEKIFLFFSKFVFRSIGRKYRTSDAENHAVACCACSHVCTLHGRNAVRLSGETAGNCAYTLHIDVVQHTARARAMRQNMLSRLLLVSYLTFTSFTLLPTVSNKITFIAIDGSQSYWKQTKKDIFLLIENAIRTKDSRKKRKHFQAFSF